MSHDAISCPRCAGACEQRDDPLGWHWRCSSCGAWWGEGRHASAFAYGCLGPSSIVPTTSEGGPKCAVRAANGKLARLQRGRRGE